MDKRLVNLKGSENRDTFKQAHKEFLGNGFYGGDLDYVVVEFKPPGIVAFYDYKMPGDSVSNTEVVYYNELIKIAPLYIVESQKPREGPFKIDIYLLGKTNGIDIPPTVCTQEICICKNWFRFRCFEAIMRTEYRKKAKN